MKKFNAILKNSDKFNSGIKLAKGLIIDYNEKRQRDGYIGAGTKVFGEFWFKSQKGEVLVKDIFKPTTRTGELMGNVSMIKAFNEIICNLLLKQMDINCAEYIPANVIDSKTNTSEQALASVSFLKDGDKLLSLKDICGTSNKTLKDIMNGLKENAHNYAENINFEQIYYSLYSYMVFDLLTCQNDRNWGNISFIVDKNKKMSLAPLYDNEYSFFADTFIFYNSKDESYNSVENYFDNYFIGRGLLSTNGISSFMGLDSFDEIANQIISLAKKDKKCDEILINILNNANLTPVFKKLQQQGYEYDKDYQEFASQILKLTRDRMAKLYKNYSKQFNTVER